MLDENELLGRLEVCELRRAIRMQQCMLGVGSLAQRHQRDDFLTPPFTWAADHQCVGDGRVRSQDLFDFLHEHLLPAGVYDQGIATEYCRIRALPVSDEVASFVARHERVYVIEQNRDGQIASVLRARLSGSLADRLRSVCHYSGTPIAAANIVRPILGWEKTPSGPGFTHGANHGRNACSRTCLR